MGIGSLNDLSVVLPRELDDLKHVLTTDTCPTHSAHGTMKMCGSGEDKTIASEFKACCAPPSVLLMSTWR